jgi:hypothetical protein
MACLPEMILIDDTYKRHYIEVDEAALHKYLLEMFAEELQKTHMVSALVRMPDGKWLIKLSPDLWKQSQGLPRASESALVVADPADKVSR